MVELGRCWRPENAAAAHVGPYTATIREGTEILATLAVPKHWWFGRWRWQSAPRSIVRTPAELTALGLVPAFDPSLVAHAEWPDVPDARRPVYVGPMSTSGIWEAMGTGGDRPDIGLLTAYQALALQGDAAAVAATMAQAEGAAAFRWHARDERTGAQINIFEHPFASTNKAVTPNAEWIDALIGDPVYPEYDAAHVPNLCYVPYLLTGDPYYLEEMQFLGAWSLVHDSKAKGGPDGTWVSELECRAWAWAMRDLFQLARVTPEVVPSWLLPRSHWQAIVADNYGRFHSAYVRSSDPRIERFHAGPFKDAEDVKEPIWQKHYLISALAHGVRLGFVDWKEALDWSVYTPINLASGLKGWPKEYPVPYAFIACWPDGTPCADYADAWALFAQTDLKGHPRPPDPSTWKAFPDWTQANDTVERVYFGVAALAIAKQAGCQVADIDLALANMRAYADRGFEKGHGMYAQCCFASEWDNVASGRHQGHRDAV